MSSPIQTRAQQIELPSFTGPLDLLLHLIERQELDITAISLSKITEQYLLQVEELKTKRIEQLIDFLVIGAQLVLIKSRALLPKPPAAIAIHEEEQEDPGEALARRLREYKQFKEAAQWLLDREAQGLRTYLRLASPPRPVVETRLDLSAITTQALHEALQNVLARAERQEDSVKVAEKPRITIEGQMSRLRQAIKQQGQILFGELLSTHPDRAELSVSLLATLELIKRREVAAYQAEMFGPITIAPAVEDEA